MPFSRSRLQRPPSILRVLDHDVKEASFELLVRYTAGVKLPLEISEAVFSLLKSYRSPICFFNPFVVFEAISFSRMRM